MPYEFEITRFVEFSETDAAGIMHFSNFFRFMESAEHAFFRSLGISLAQPGNGLEIGLPRVHAECDYAAPLRVEDKVRVHLLVERKGRSSLSYQYRFSRLNGSSPAEVARGRVTAVCVKRRANGTFKSVPLPRIIADKIEQAPAALLGTATLPVATASSLVVGSAPKRNLRLQKPRRIGTRRANNGTALSRRQPRLRVDAARAMPVEPVPDTGAPHRRD